MYAGSFNFPLFGSGVKYGASVSTINLSTGIKETVSTNSLEFLNVIIPLTEIKQSISSNFLAKFLKKKH